MSQPAPKSSSRHPHAREGEARKLARYLAGVELHDEELTRYDAAFEALNLAGNSREERLIKIALNNSFLLGVFDAGVEKNHPLRRRLVVMAAILETTPRHAELFFPSSQVIIHLIPAIVWHGSFAVVKRVLGKFLVRGFLR